MKNILIVISITVLAGGLLCWGTSAPLFSSSSRPSIPEEEIIARRGIHWHPELAIYVKGIRQEIPANIGIGAVHQPIHTHDATGVLHLEFQGLVRKRDIVLGQFFKNWGRDMQSFGNNVNMKVNGKERTEFENYGMQDKDKIELRFDE